MGTPPYPLRYPLTRGWKIFFVFGVLFLLALSGASLWDAHAHPERGANALHVSYGLAALFLLFAATCVPPLLRPAVILHADAFEVAGMFGTRRVARAEIKGCRVVVVQGITMLKVAYVRNGREKAIDIGRMFQSDAAFDAWFAKLPNLDDLDTAAALREAQADPRLGASPLERSTNLQRARRAGLLLNLAGMAACGWLWFYPYPYTAAFVVVLMLPWIAMVLVHRKPGAFTVEGRNQKREPRAELVLLLLMPGFVLMLRAISDVNLVDYNALVVPALVGLAVLLACLLAVEASFRRRIGMLLLMALLLAPYPPSAMMLANTLFDTGPVAVHTLPVLRKHHTSGKGAAPYFTVPAWGPVTEQHDIQVSEAFYGATAEGQPICVRLHSGALGMAWYSAHPRAAC